MLNPAVTLARLRHLCWYTCTLVSHVLVHLHACVTRAGTLARFCYTLLNFSTPQAVEGVLGIKDVQVGSHALHVSPVLLELWQCQQEKARVQGQLSDAWTQR